MAGLIPDNILEDILSRVDIVEVISGYLPLKKAGRNFKANCPFHHEKTPSFMVSPDRQIYHCFGCGESGNAFKFLMRHERMEFPEAAELLAAKAGVALPKNKAENPAVVSLSTNIFQANEAACRFYSGTLASPSAWLSREYLKKRGLTEESVKDWLLGFAPDKWDSLCAHLRQKGFNMALLDKAGLIVAKDGGGYRDRFHNRLIFPISDKMSRILGFGARVMDSTLPKYINSPETAVYTKGRHLYGLNRSKDAIRQEDYAVIVEGYLDCIIPFQEGLCNIVASCGTAFTQDQARLLKRYTRNVVVVFDGDTAGELAALRSLDIFIEEDMAVTVVTLPQGFDPDLFVRQRGIGEFKKLIKGATDLFDYKLSVLRQKYGLKDVQAKARISSLMLETIKKIKNEIISSEYLKKLAQALDIREDALIREFGKLKPNEQELGVQNAGVRPAAAFSPAQKLLVKLMLEENDFIQRVRSRVNPEDFQDERLSRVVAFMFDLAAQGKEVRIQSLVSHFEDEHLTRLVCESAFLPEGTSVEHKAQMMEDCIKRLMQDKFRSRRHSLHEEIKEAQQAGDEKRVYKLMEEFQGLIKIEGERQ